MEVGEAIRGINGNRKNTINKKIFKNLSENSHDLKNYIVSKFKTKLNCMSNNFMLPLFFV